MIKTKQFLRQSKTIFLLLVFVGWLVGCQSDNETIANLSDGSISGMGDILDNQDMDNLDTFEDIAVGFTEEGYPFRGDPFAPVTIIEYSDYLCPFCGRHTIETIPLLLEQYVRTGQVKIVFRDYPIEALHPTADFGHVASLCVAEQGAVLFWKMHDELFARQAAWSGLPDPTDWLANVAEEIGADTRDYRRCVESGRKEADVSAGVAEARSLGFSGTPSFNIKSSDSEDMNPFIGAQPIEAFGEWVNALAAGQPPPIPPTPEPPKPPVWLANEGLLPDPNRPGYTMAGDAYYGSLDAPLIVVEFLDFQCPPCQRHFEETQPLVDAQFIETGQIRWVVKHLPFRDHEWAVLAAVTSECAGDQGQFWEMHDRLFETADEWSEGDAETIFLGLAEELGLDMTLFESCFNSRDVMERILEDIYHGQGVTGQTPTFAATYNENGRLLQGGVETDVFISTMEGLLELATSDDSPPDETVPNNMSVEPAP